STCYYVDSGGVINIKTGDLVVNAAGLGVSANYMKSQISIEATGDVNIIAHGLNDTRAIHAGNATTEEEIAKSDTSFVSIKAKNINLTADKIGVSAMSNAWVELDGNTTINAAKAIVARGMARVNINKSGLNTVKMDGDIDFNYDKLTSGTKVDAIVDVTLAGADSYWTGNTVASYGSGQAPDESYMKVNSVSLTMKDGATWNATKVVDNMNEDTSGSGYVAMNYLTVDNGTVNIADTTRGIVVENANIKDATFNGGKLNVGTMNLTGGTNTFNNNVVGIDNASALTIANGATMNIGTNTVNVANITLDGTMLATLRNGDAQITAGTFGGDGTLKLSLNGEGTYNVFGDAAFRNAGIEVTSSLYDLTWNGGVATATKKSAAAVAQESGIEEKAAAAVLGMSQSTSEKLNTIAEKIQEKLAEATPEARHEAEQAAKAVHPETESVAQSMASAVQTAVTNLAGARMAAPIVGRSGGDVIMTSGGVWAQGLFNKSKQNDAFHGYTRGIAVGMDGTLNKVWTVGAGYSYAHSDISGSARATEIDSNTVFLYGQYKPAEWYVNAVANYTMGDYSEEGTAMGTPVTADYDVDSFGASLAAGYDLDFGLTPELGLRYMHVMADDYTNSLGVKTKSDNTNFLTGVLGAKYAFNVVADKYTTFIPQLNAALKYDMLSDKNTATVTMPGVDAYTLDVERLSRFGGEFGIGLGMKHRSLDFSINYDIDVRKDYTSQTGMLKFRYNF
ncbi:MAG: autotransporter domain-containing protein, partial [Alphaproteobacteria bacterium]|nr:autotransporter domain-containing protein [Alphaproteobacteria bacterium]